MAAPMFSGIKLSKSERKALKKHSKSKHTFYKHESISISNEPTQHIVVGNGGLDNNVQREELLKIFSTYGNVLDVIMKPQKPYSFVTFSRLEESLESFRQLHGRMMACPAELSVPNVTFHLSFIEEVPGFEIPSKTHPPGLILINNVISECDEQTLLEGIDWDTVEKGLSEGAKQSLKHRCVRHYGYEFIYGMNNVDLTRPMKEGLPPMCGKVLHTLVEYGHVLHYPDQLTVNQYQPGQGIPSHIDTHSAFEDCIISLSLGSQVVMDFHHPDGRHVPIFLPQRSALIMTGESRYVWTHGITPRKSDIVSVSSLKQMMNPSNCTTNSLYHDTKTANNTQTADNSQTADQTNTTEHHHETKTGDCGISDHNYPEGCPSSKDRLTMAKRGTRTSFTFRKVLRGPCVCKYPEQCDSQKNTGSKITVEDSKTVKPVMPDTDEQAVLLEKIHVHEVYEDIADHFSDTRHKAWPRVAEFITQQALGSLIVDIGCGNGKYMGINQQTYKIGCDRSMNLCEICMDHGYQVLVCDMLAVPYRDNCCDVAISIAVIHHLSTWARRVRAIEEMVRVLRPGGKALVSVWALEQELNQQKSNYLKNSKTQKKEATLECSEGISVDVPEPVESSSISFNHEDKSLGVHVNRTQFDSQDLLVPWHKKDKANRPARKDATKCEGAGGEEVDSLNTKSAEPVYHRFYHVFKEGELMELVGNVPNVHVMDIYYDKGNWCVIFEKNQ